MISEVEGGAAAAEVVVVGMRGGQLNLAQRRRCKGSEQTDG